MTLNAECCLISLCVVCVSVCVWCVCVWCVCGVGIQVEWLQQQVIHSRTRRNSRASHIYSIDVRTKLDHHNQRSPNQTQTQDRVQSQNQAQTQAQTFTFNDPQWSSQWYLVRVSLV